MIIMLYGRRGRRRGQRVLGLFVRVLLLWWVVLKVVWRGGELAEGRGGGCGRVLRGRGGGGGGEGGRTLPGWRRGVSVCGAGWRRGGRLRTRVSGVCRSHGPLGAGGLFLVDVGVFLLAKVIVEGRPGNWICRQDKILVLGCCCVEGGWMMISIEMNHAARRTDGLQVHRIRQSGLETAEMARRSRQGSSSCEYQLCLARVIV
jgi:hypothetical protein